MKRMMKKQMVELYTDINKCDINWKERSKNGADWGQLSRQRCALDL